MNIRAGAIAPARTAFGPMTPSPAACRNHPWTRPCRPDFGAHAAPTRSILRRREHAGGFPDNVVRTVSENARTLKLGESGFEVQ